MIILINARISFNTIQHLFLIKTNPQENYYGRNFLKIVTTFYNNFIDMFYSW